MFHKPWQRWLIAALLSLSLYSPHGAWSQQADQPPLASEERLKRDITFLASEECEGRAPGTKGIERAADYIVNQFKEMGLKPAGVNGTWFQPFMIGGAPKLAANSVLKLQGPDNQEIELKLGDSFQVLGNTGSGNVTAPLVFVGYGITAKDANFDEYKDLDVAGKVVIFIRRVPRWSDKDKPFDGDRRDAHASLEEKLALAEKHKAAGMILINDASEQDDKLIPFTQVASAAPVNVPAMQASRAALEPVFKSGLKKSLAEIEKAIDANLKPQSGVVQGWSATLDCKVSRPGVAVKNILGTLEGAGPLANEIVVVGAHYDHIGISPKTKAINYGADDNASGTTALMELARRFVGMKNRQGRRLVFIAFSAEERGLLGSKHYCKEPLFPLAQTVTMLNFDMVGRLRFDQDNKGGRILVDGAGTAKGFEQLIDKLTEEAGFEVIKNNGGNGYSDHDTFFRTKIPVLYIKSGRHPEYHTPKDKVELINVPGMKRIIDLVERVAATIASDPVRPEFVNLATLPKKFVP